MKKDNHIRQMLDLVRQEGISSVDIETRGEGSTVITSIAFTLNAGKSAFAIPLDGSYFTRMEEKALWSEIRKTLEAIKVVGQNFLFDWGILADYGVWDMRLAWDTMVAQHLLFTDFPRSLASMVSLYTDRKPHKAMIHEDLYTYNALDVLTTWEVYCEQYNRFKPEELEYAEYVWRLHKPLIVMEKRGLYVDLSYKEQALKDMQSQLDEIQERLNNVTHRVVKPNSTQDLQAYFYAEKGVKPYLNKTTGNPRVDKDALEKLSKWYPEASIILEYRKIQKLVTTYFNMTLDSDGRLRCQIKPTGTVTGRLATSKTVYKTGGNLQNIPPAYGYCILPDPGYIFIEADLEQAEKRLVALITGDKNDIQDFKNGVDVHTRQAAKVLHKDESEVTKAERNKIGKPLNHATSYDVGYKTFANTAGIPQNEAYRILEKYHKEHPQLKKFFRKIRKDLANSNVIYNLFGRPRSFYGYRDSQLYRSAYDYIPQSTTGDICNRAIIDLYEQGPSWLQLLMQIHDSILVQVPDDENHVASACEYIQKFFYYTFEYNGHTLDIPVEFNIGYRWNKKYLVEFKENPREAYRQVSAG